MSSNASDLKERRLSIDADPFADAGGEVDADAGNEVDADAGPG